jgi:hypothetical protein
MPGMLTSPAVLANGPGARQCPAAVDDTAIQPGDRVVSLQVAGVLRVVARRGRLLDVESDRGLRLTLHEVGLRKLNGTPPAPKDA